MLECKSTKIKEGGKKQITLKKKAHDKIESEAKKEGMTPFIVYGFKDSNGNIDKDNIYFSARYDYLLDILSKIKYLEEKIERFKDKIEKLEEGN